MNGKAPDNDAIASLRSGCEQKMKVKVEGPTVAEVGRESPGAFEFTGALATYSPPGCSVLQGPELFVWAAHPTAIWRLLCMHA